MPSGDNQTLSPAKQALVALRELQARLRTLEESRNEPVAILGMGCRYPGMEGVEAFWHGLCAAADTVGDVPEDRWNAAELYDPDPAAPGKMTSRRGGFLAHLDRFDAEFFGISPREAPHVDPRQRVLLEVVWEALEAAGVAPHSLAGSATGVFVSTLTNDYDHLLFSDLTRADAYSGAGTANSILANRISYFLDLHGPSLALDTACSGSLVAVHLACESLRRGESSLALAGGVNVNLMPKSNVFFSKAGALSPDGCCKTFDRDANGMVRSDGAGIVVLKLLSQARRDQDPIVAVIRGSAVNHDGRSNGIMAPNGEAQRRVVTEALRRAGVAPADVQLIEAHGTGTRLGDPIEVQALGDVLTNGRAPGRLCALGSVKTNIGHTEAAAGVAGIIKTALALRHRKIPPSLHLSEPNPLIPFDRLPFVVPGEAMPWPHPERALVAGVSAFGFGGTNAHIVLEEAPPESATELSAARTAHSTPCLVPLSAASPRALEELARRWLAFLPASSGGLAELAFTAGVRRSHLPCRVAVLATTREELRDTLQQRLPLLEARAAKPEPPAAAPRAVFVFSGQGSHWPRMGLRLFGQEPLFRARLEECDRLLSAHVSWSLIDELRREPATSRIDETEIAQPAIFAIQVALAALWQSWGIVPDAIVGHSLGEVAAAHVAGVLSLEDAVRVVVERSRLMRLAAGQGRTAVVGLPPASVGQRLGPYHGRLVIAGSNSSASSVVSGDPGAVEAFVHEAEADGVFCRVIPGVDIAFHSPHMDPLQAELASALSGIHPGRETIPLFSTVTAGRQNGVECDAGYWARNLREPFLFAQVTELLLEQGYRTFLEVSPHAVLTSAILQTSRHGGVRGVTVLPSLRRDDDERRGLLTSLAAFYEQGYPIHWKALTPAPNRCVPLPSYPWQRQRYWYDQLGAGDGAARRDAALHPLLGDRFEPALPVQSASDPVAGHGWEMEMDAGHPRYLTDHRILGEVVLPGSACIEMAWQAGRQVLAGAVAVTGLTFENALKLPAGAPRRVQVMLTGAGDERSFFLFSRTAAGHGAWVRHATGTVVREAALPPADFALERARARCSEPISPDTHYDRMRAGGLEYGPAFRVIRELWQGDGEALARIQLTGAPDSRYAMHPILLDAALQIAAAAFPEARTEQPERYLPHAVRCWRILQPPRERIWCHAVMRESPGPDQLVADLTITDERGTVVAELEGLVLKAVAGSTGRSVRESLLREEWEECPLPASPVPAGRWLIVPDRGGVGAELAQQLRAAGHQVTVAVHSAIDIPAGTASGREEPHGELASLLQSTGAELSGLVHLRGLDSPAPQAGPEALDEAQRSGCGSALGVVQAMLNAGCSARLWLVTCGAQPVQPEPLRIEQAPLYGMGLVIAQEHPELRCTCLDLDPAVHALSDSAATLAGELLHADREQRLAWRGGRRFGARLRRAAPPEPGGELALRLDATYLITGGMGALGLRTASLLAAGGARHLALTGRSGAAGKEHLLQPLRNAGVDVRVFAADLASPADVDCLLRQIGAEMPPLRGVIHSAGVLDDGLLREQTVARFQTVMAPKVQGAWNLHFQTFGLPLDFFILYSSAASLVGSAGQSNYAAANAFLDALAHHRSASGLPAVSINWGAWRDGGMAARQQILRRMETRGVGSIDPAEGLELLASMIASASGRPRLGVLPVDWPRFLQQFAGEVPTLFTALEATGAADTGSFRRTLALASPEARDSLLRTWLRDALAAVLGFDASAIIHPRQGFFELGMDSLMALEFRNRLEGGLGLGLPTTLVFDFPNLELLQGFLAETLVAELDPRPTTAAPAPEAHAAADDLEALSSEDLARLLAIELEEGGD